MEIVDSPTGPQGQTLEVWTEKYDNGKVEYQYYRDLEGKVVKHGYYKEYGEDGKIEIESTYKEDTLDGKYVEYDRDGQIVAEGEYKEGGKWSGKFIEYYKNGQISWERNYKDGKLDGKSVWYDDEGNITGEYCYDMGRRVDCP